MLRLLEKIFVIAMLFYTTGAILPFLFADEGVQPTSESNPYFFAIQLGFYLVAFCFIALHWRTVMRGALHVKWIVGLSLIAVCSTVWSQDPFLTVRRSIVLLATTVFGIYFGSRFTISQQLRLLAWTLAFVIFSSFAIALFLPQFGVDHFYHPGDWQGAFHQKNMLGRSMVLAVMVFHFVRSSVGRMVSWAGLAGALVLLFLSHSLTAAFALMAILAVVILCRVLRARFTIAIPLLVALVLAALASASVLTLFQDEVFQLLHRGSDLSGRTDLWSAVWRAIMTRPFLGYGFDAFWRGMSGDSATVWLTVQWKVLHSHNGFLDLALNLGLLGVVVFAVGYFDICRRALKLMKSMPGFIPVWLCAYLSFMFFYNLSESSILAEDNIFWILYTAAGVNVVLGLRDNESLPETIPANAR